MRALPFVPGLRLLDNVSKRSSRLRVLKRPHAFASSRVNRVNERREFFFATPEQVRVVLAEKVGNLLEFTLEPVADQYLQSKKYWPVGT